MCMYLYVADVWLSSSLCCNRAEGEDAGDEAVSITLEEALDKLESLAIEVSFLLKVFFPKIVPRI